MNKRDRIENLLIKENSLLSSKVLKILTKTPLSNIISTGGVLIDEIQEIYQRRAQHAQEEKLNIEGMSDLLQGLDATSCKLLKMHLIETEHEHVLIFTDTSLIELLGVLVIEKKR